MSYIDTVLEDINFIITEQEPCGESIYCEVKFKYDNGNTLTLGKPYFVCNLKREITQYPLWAESNLAKQKLKKLGYKL